MFQDVAIIIHENHCYFLHIPDDKQHEMEYLQVGRERARSEKRDKERHTDRAAQ